MLFRNTWQVPAACLMLIVPTATVGAQEAASSFDQLRMLVKAGDTVTVTDTSGHEIKGKIAEISSSSLALATKDGRSTLAEGDVTTISKQRHGSLATGAKWGLGVGGGLGLIVALSFLGDGCSDCAAYAVVSGGLYAGLGTGIGVGVSAATMHRKTLFSRPGAAPSKLTVSPLLTHSRKGVLVSYGF
jgi:hypothetical protein